MTNKRTWAEFRECGLLWWINRQLHLFGWAIVFEMEEGSDNPRAVYPARVGFRGFGPDTEREMFARLTSHVVANIEHLSKEVGVSTGAYRAREDGVVAKRSCISDYTVCGACMLAHSGEPGRSIDHLVQISGMPMKTCLAAMNRAYKRGLIDCGVSLETAWVTEKGRVLVIDEGR